VNYFNGLFILTKEPQTFLSEVFEHATVKRVSVELKLQTFWCC